MVNPAPYPASTEEPRWLREFFEVFTRRMREEMKRLWGAEDECPEELGDPEDLARRALASIPSPTPWDDALGPFYDTRQVALLLGDISRQAVADRRRRGTLLGLKTTDDAMVYPTFQFGRDHQVLKSFPPVLQALRESPVDDWTLAGWLVAPQEALDGESVIDWLRQGRDLAPALTLARDAALRFSR